MNTNISEDVYICPSFNSYSSDRLAEIAVRIAGNGGEVAADDEDFEFAFVREGNDEVLTEERRIGPVFPVFNCDLFNEDEESEASVAVPLSKLFIKEDNERDDNNNDNPPSCSSSEADELEQIPAGTYCVWRPKLAESPGLPSRCKKSKSTGSSSRRWRLRDLMRRSNSDGKDSFVFLTPKHHHREPSKSEKSIQSSKGNKPLRSTAGGGVGSPSPHEEFYVRNRAMNEAEKKKSYLPYRQDLLGFFANVNGLRRSFPRF